MNMPRGPKGEKRPADVIGNAVMVARIATGEIEDASGKAPNRAKGGKVGGKARAQKLSSEQRAAIARKGAATRWAK
jgi:hypothetical protein